VRQQLRSLTSKGVLAGERVFLSRGAGSVITGLLLGRRAARGAALVINYYCWASLLWQPARPVAVPQAFRERSGASQRGLDQQEVPQAFRDSTASDRG
jgi:hypothetical protein